jgi:hypothetical protein
MDVKLFMYNYLIRHFIKFYCTCTFDLKIGILEVLSTAPFYRNFSIQFSAFVVL